ncbi:hypothetical protein IZ6_22210 [Terrihabitans soli]|uniref:Class I SAM-dependent methyltransferase n=1 Tax=Terrihabitans soli TaxID=708113 RepID=A0A6S6QPT1_9HYPH|nr:class I SAM-dependent methyltransferase [Terrihabitans soli]BCJ91486.1 hypothetical protein IZ6_22210 [Terrihabitans soli]
MTPGQIARRLLGRHFEPVGHLYRRFFMDTDKMAGRIAAAIPAGAKCLDIGGGDGMIANALLERRSDISITMIDLAASIGGFVDPKFAGRIALHPATPVDAFTANTGAFDATLITDVLHHIPAGFRPQFFADVKRQMEKSGCRVLLVKEVMPGRLRSFLGVLSDKYITGDKNVALLARTDIQTLAEATFGIENIERFAVEVPDAPNYFAVIRLSETPRAA